MMVPSFFSRTRRQIPSFPFFISFSCFTLLSVFSFHQVTADLDSHRYKIDEHVDLWVNKIGPYHNPQETYEYYDIPYCKPDHGIDSVRKSHSLGEQLEGHELHNSGYHLHFGTMQKEVKVCTLTLDDTTRSIFNEAIENHYWYQLYIDDLPIWGMVGESIQSEQANGDIINYLYTHRRFSVGFNDDRIIEVNMTSEKPMMISGPKAVDSVTFTYDISWIPTNKLFANRFDRYLDFDFFGHQIHWFSIFNSTMMVIFLCGLVALILFRTLKNDFARYALEEDEIEMTEPLRATGNSRKNRDKSNDHEVGMGGFSMVEDSGWKQVSKDVFRAPPYLPLFAALYGVGWQLIILILVVILYALAGPIHGDVYEERGELTISFIICYALTCFIAGYVSGGYYAQYFNTPRSDRRKGDKSQWKMTLFLTLSIFPTVIISVVLFLNFLAESYDTTNALHLSSILKILAIWLFISLPLTVLGTILGRIWNSKADFPLRPSIYPKEIPLVPWYMSPLVIIAASGILPFFSIFIEMYFIFTSLWNYKFYFVFGFMLLVYIILFIVSICTTIVSVYFVLNSENYHWQWISFLSSGSTATYVFIYSIYYFFFKTKMTGLLQTSFYFGYMFMFCFALFLLCGSIGHAGASIFVKKIYRNIKVD